MRRRDGKGREEARKGTGWNFTVTKQKKKGPRPPPRRSACNSRAKNWEGREFVLLIPSYVGEYLAKETAGVRTHKEETKPTTALRKKKKKIVKRVKRKEKDFYNRAV